MVDALNRMRAGYWRLRQAVAEPAHEHPPRPTFPGSI
jgi:hypothetical protein